MMKKIEKITEIHDALRNAIAIAVTAHVWNKYRKGTITDKEEKIRKLEKEKMNKYADQYYKEQLRRGNSGKMKISNIVSSLKKYGLKSR